MTKLDQKFAQGVRDGVNALILEVERLECVADEDSNILKDTLYSYMETELSEGKIDFRIRASKEHISGVISFYIYPDSKDGRTLDLVLKPKG